MAIAQIHTLQMAFATEETGAIAWIVLTILKTISRNRVINPVMWILWYSTSDELEVQRQAAIKLFKIFTSWA